MHFFIDGIKRYVDFSGRACRLEYWMYILFYFIFWFLFAILDSLLGLDITEKSPGVLTSIYGFALLVPTIAISFRRINDVGKSPVWLLVWFIPIIGVIWFIILMCEE